MLLWSLLLAVASVHASLMSNHNHDSLLLTATSPITGRAYQVVPAKVSHGEAAAVCARIDGQLATVDTGDGDIAWLGSTLATARPVWIAALNGHHFDGEQCAALYPGGAIAVPKAPSHLGPCDNLEHVLCQL